MGVERAKQALPSKGHGGGGCKYLGNKIFNHGTIMEVFSYNVSFQLQ